MPPTQLAKNTRPLRSPPFNAGGRERVKVPESKAATGIRVRVSGTLDNAQDNTTNAARNDLGEAKLLEQVELVLDGENLYDLRGDEGFVFQLPFLSEEGPELTQVDPTVASSDFSFTFLIPLTPWKLLNRVEAFRTMHLSRLIKPESELEVILHYEGDAANGNSDDGTGALADGGDHSYSLSGMSVDVDLVYNEIARDKLFFPESAGQRAGEVRIPRFIPKVESQRSDETWSAARPDLPVTVHGDLPVLASVLFEVEGDGPTSTVEDMVNELELTVEDEEIRMIQKAALVEEAVDELPGIRRNDPPGADGNGIIVLNYAAGGKIGGILKPGQTTSTPEFTLDVAAPPGGGDGHVDHIMLRAASVPGATAGFRR